MYHPTNYEMTKSIFSTLTYNFIDEQMHIFDCHSNRIHNSKISGQIQKQTLPTNSSFIVKHIIFN